MDASVRAAAVERCGGACEFCGSNGAGYPLEGDHLFGRKEVDHVTTLVMLCRVCHFNRTNNVPSAQANIRKALEWADKHGYGVTHGRLLARLGVQILKWGVKP